jgi:alpha-L-rhamnosidase
VRTGWLETSDGDLNRLHENVLWSMRSNFVDVPTDCPQRNERLGWTGDIQVFAPTASYLYDVRGFLSSWLKDLAVEQSRFGTVPWYVPVIPGGKMWTPIQPGAAWGDAAVLVPDVLWNRYGDRGVLARQYQSARDWVDQVARLAGPRRLWNTGFQLAIGSIRRHLPTTRRRRRPIPISWRRRTSPGHRVGWPRSRGFSTTPMTR